MSTAHLTDTLRVNGYTVPPCTIDGVGDWQGQEERAAEQFRALTEQIAQWMPDPRESDAPALALGANYERLCREAWDAVGSDDALLTWTPDELRVIAAATVDAGQFTLTTAGRALVESQGV